MGHDPAEFLEEHHPLPPCTGRLLPFEEQHRIRNIRQFPLLDESRIPLLSSRYVVMPRCLEILCRPRKKPVRLCQILGIVDWVAISVTESRTSRLPGLMPLITFASWRRILSWLAPFLEPGDDIAVAVPFIGDNAVVKIQFGEVIEPDGIHQCFKALDMQGTDNLLPHILFQPGERDISDLVGNKDLLRRSSFMRRSVLTTEL